MLLNCGAKTNFRCYPYLSTPHFSTCDEGESQSQGCKAEAPEETDSILDLLQDAAAALPIRSGPSAPLSLSQGAPSRTVRRSRPARRRSFDDSILQPSRLANDLARSRKACHSVLDCKDRLSVRVDTTAILVCTDRTHRITECHVEHVVLCRRILRI